LKFTERELVIAHRILKEIRERSGFWSTSVWTI